MKHLIVMNHGAFIGNTQERLVIQEGDERREFALNRLRTLTIARSGVSISGSLLLRCAMHGIRVFILDSRHHLVVELAGASQHAVVQLRKKQFGYLDSRNCIDAMRRIVHAKIRNQRAVLLYFAKYMAQHEPSQGKALQEIAGQMQALAVTLRAPGAADTTEVMRAEYMGYEGRAAALYWQALRRSELLPPGFTGRSGRGATDAANQALNLGYAILQTFVWNALANAGLEVYAGILHTDRAGKPSLVLDVMESLRPWVVDRAIIKLRQRLGQQEQLNRDLSQAVVASVHDTFHRKYIYRKKRLRLETILQRQAYRLAGEFCNQQVYKPYLFRW
ncbi:MAG: CRISPR-associated endonuclease Cas1 [Leptospiraceae bacterium]|nr:CRISPR-associated endonuclease Cas1 [Leptospiraceae bacterium]